MLLTGIILIGAAAGIECFSAVSSSGARTAPSLFPSHFEKSSVPPDSVALTYLEINGWLLTASGVTVLIDPILEGPLDFGIPAVYSASKRSLPARGLCDSLPPIDCVLITQGLDDHAHERTLSKLAEMDGTVTVVAPPSARGALERSGFSSRGGNVRFIRPGESTVIEPRDLDVGASCGRVGVNVRATTGALVGPPWQARENGYILRPLGDEGSQPPSFYIEPHVEFDVRELALEAPVDFIITPISGQGLPAFELVHGPSDAVRLVKTLKAKCVLPMQNGDIDAEGLASQLVQSVGTPEEFRRRLLRDPNGKSVKVLKVVPGDDMQLTR